MIMFANTREVTMPINVVVCFYCSSQDRLSRSFSSSSWKALPRLLSPARILLLCLIGGGFANSFPIKGNNGGGGGGGGAPSKALTYRVTHLYYSPPSERGP